MKAAIVLAIIIALCFGAREKDTLKTPLPGCSNTQFKQFSGYLDVTESKKFHFVYVESESKPAQDPVVFWFNGGPGCSSMIGYIQEHGPCVFIEDSDHAPRDNPYSWNKFANMVYLESPAGVGYNAFSGSFSYDDENVSHENLKALQLFFEAFPELKTRDLYLAGESYAGIYIPYLALRIDEFNQKSSEKINLKGFMIGNGVTNWKYDVTPAFVKMSYSHGLISNSLHQKLEKLNCDFADVGSKPLSPECNEAFIAFRESVAQVYPYDIYRPPEDIYQAKTSVMSIEKMLKLETDANSKSMSYINFSKVFGDRQSNDFAVVDRFMNTDDVKNALNVPLSHGWKECTPINYTKLEKATQWIYPLLKGKYRMMHYSGDTDGVVPTIGTIGWMEDLGWKVTKKYSPWMAEKLIIGGYTESREDLDLITIHGCGHMAPQWKRQPSFVAISSWLQNKDLPRP